MASELVLVRQQHVHGGDVPDYHEWVYLDNFRADSRGRSNPRMYSASWQRWRCNNPECPAWALVADEFIQHALDSVGAVDA